MDDFIFRGRDIADFGAVAAFGAAMKTGAKIERSEYDLPGGGSVIIGEDSYKPTTRQVVIMPADGVDADAAWARRILSWLMAGRGELIVHNDPDVVRLAQFDSEATYGTQDWPLGALKLTMTLQPLAYARRAWEGKADTVSGAASLTIAASSAMEMPLAIEVTAKSGVITACEMRAGGHVLAMSGLSVQPGQTILYDAGQRLSDLMTLTAGGAAAFSRVTAWARLAAWPGDSVSVRLTGGEGRVHVACRGRYPS